MSLGPDESDSLSEEQLEDFTGGTMDQTVGERDCAAMLSSLVNL
jgi:hypothetical protein